nr:SH3 domain-containing protein 1-like [Ziziphus jujuba var. spinosa]
MYHQVVWNNGYFDKNLIIDNVVQHFQRNVHINSALNNLVRKLVEDCCKYGSENQSTHTPLARASLSFGTSYNAIEKEREDFLKILSDQTQISGASLEDARHLAYRYDKLRQDVEAQVTKVLRRRSKSRDLSMSGESSVKLQSAEARLADLKSSTVALGREATAAMLSVEDQQQ